LDTEQKIRIGVAAVACAIAFVVGTTLFWKALGALTPELMRPLIADRFLVVIFLPLSAMSALLIVMIFRSASGPIEFEALGFKFKGAAGETVMWILTFLAFTVAAKALW
jgi:hypothetical protein